MMQINLLPDSILVTKTDKSIVGRDYHLNFYDKDVIISIRLTKEQLKELQKDMKKEFGDLIE